MQDPLRLELENRCKLAPKKLSTLYSLLQQAVERLAAKGAKPAPTNWTYALDQGHSAKASLAAFLMQRKIDKRDQYWIEKEVLLEIVALQKEKRSKAVAKGNRNRRKPE